MRDGADDRLRKAKAPLSRLAIRVDAVHSVLDEMLAAPLPVPGSLPNQRAGRASEIADELLSLASDLEDSIRALREEREMAVLQARDWGRRAELATEAGRPDHARQARVRQREHESMAERNDPEIVFLEDELGQCLLAVRRLACLSVIARGT